MTNRRGLWINNQPVETKDYYVVTEKYRQTPLAEVAEASQEDVARAIAAAHRALGQPLSVPERYDILNRAAALLEERRETIARTLCRESGKPIRDARAEVGRGIQTLRYSALAAMTLKGEEVPVRGNPGSERRLAFTIRKPYGVVAAITPFNFPLNLVLHKVGPALAGGNAVVLKPAPTTPLTSLLLAEALADAGLPAGWLNVITGQKNEVGEWLVGDPRVELITFTGSAGVGRIIRQNAGLRPVLLELGNNSANLVHSDADLGLAAKSLAQRAYGYAGQVCISVQRIYVHRPVYEEFSRLLTEATRALVIGDPEDDATDLGPMITEAAAERAESWYREALHQGAKELVAGARQGALLSPVLLADVAPSMRVMSQEVFAPMAGLVPYDDFDQALHWANDGVYGLQAGVFTQNLDLALRAAEVLEVGGVIINDTSSYRADNMPYGGIRESGIGREGPEYAIQEMTYPTVVVFNR